VVSQDAYGRGPVRRTITSLRGAVRSGNSGGPMVDGRGRVVTTIFAATTSGPRGGYGVPNSITRDAIDGASGRVSTGQCTG
jgi:S1-C subfamily serine protease